MSRGTLQGSAVPKNKKRHKKAAPAVHPIAALMARAAATPTPGPIAGNGPPAAPPPPTPGPEVAAQGVHPIAELMATANGTPDGPAAPHPPVDPPAPQQAVAKKAWHNHP